MLWRFAPYRVCALLTFGWLAIFPGACRSNTSDHGPTPKSSTQISVSTPADPTLVQANCPSFFRGKKSGPTENDELTEASDLALSVKNPGVMWSHNDSGGKARVFALTTSGRDLGTYQLEGAELQDWEDMALGPGPDPETSYLYLGDIGANNKDRKFISVYRVREPKVSLDQKVKRRKLEDAARFDFIYPDRHSHDAEALMIDQQSGDLYFVTKPRRGAPVVYRSRAPLDNRKITVLEEVTTLNSIGGPFSPTLVTSGDISRDGSMVLLRTYVNAYLWPRRPNEPIDAALTRPPCNVPLHSESQGESIAFAPDGKGYYTVSEGNHPILYFYAREE